MDEKRAVLREEQEQLYCRLEGLKQRCEESAGVDELSLETALRTLQIATSEFDQQVSLFLHTYEREWHPWASERLENTADNDERLGLVAAHVDRAARGFTQTLEAMASIKAASSRLRKTEALDDMVKAVEKPKHFEVLRSGGSPNRALVKVGENWECCDLMQKYLTLV